MTLRISQLERNDIEAAVRYFEEQLDAGTWAPHKGEALMMLQDDVARLDERLDAVIEQRRAAGKPVP